MRPTAAARAWVRGRRLSMQRRDAERLAEAAAAVQRIAVLAMARRVMRRRHQQAVTVGIAVAAVILEQAERDLLVVRIVAEPRAGHRQRLHQELGIVAGLE